MNAAGIIRAVIFDWAGTTVDFGSLAPVMAFAAVFEDARVPVSIDEIRKPMGLEKRQHLRTLLNDPAIAARWQAVHGASPTENDLDRLHRGLDDRLVDIVPRYADPIPGVLETVSKLRAANIKVGSNSGYSANMMDMLSRAARARGYEPDCVVAATDVAAGRPAPDMSLRCLKLLGLKPDCAAIKVDDTRAGIEEGRNAELWTVAVAVSGNEVGLSLEEWSSLGAQERARLRDRARINLRAAEPDYVIDTVADLPEVIDLIEMRLAAGERPVAR